MNLHGIAAPIISVVNPMRTGSIKQSTGYTIDADGTQLPAYTTISGVPMQVQSLSNDELRQLEGMNLQGNKYGVYLYGEYSGLVRKMGQGGDLLLFDGSTWLAVIVLENWGAPGTADAWVKLALVQQLDA